MTAGAVLVDEHPVYADGLARALALIRAHRPDVAKIIAEAIAEGADGHVQMAPRGRAAALSGREQRVLQMTADGMSSVRVGEALHLSRASVKANLRSIYRKLGVCERAAAVAVGMRSGLLR